MVYDGEVPSTHRGHINSRSSWWHFESFKFSYNKIILFDFRFPPSTNSIAMSNKVQETKEKHIVNADGSEHHSVTTEVKDGRSLGQKMEDAKDAFKGDPSKMQTVTKEKTEIKDGKQTHELKSETKDARSLGDKMADAKDAFTGK